MITSIHRRVRSLELVGGRDHPWHIPAAQWTEAQMTALIAPGRRDYTDEDLQRFLSGAPDHILDFLALAEEATDEQDPVPSA